MARIPTAIIFPFLFRIGFVYLLIAVTLSCGISAIQEVENYHIKCTPNTSVAILNVTNPHQEVFVHLRSDFKYLQISMKILSCYPISILRGNRYITGKVLEAESSVSMNLTYTKINGGIHAYNIAIKSEVVNFTDVINTSVKCGRFQGYRLKAVGATLCTLAEKIEITEKPDIITEKPEIYRADLQEYNVEGDDEKEYLKNINDLHRWASSAQVMAICFTLTVYILFLLAKMCQYHVLLEMLSARLKLRNSHTPLEVS